METTTRTSAHPLMILAAIAVIVFSAAGVAAIMGWIPTSRGDATPPLAAATPQAKYASSVAQTATQTPVGAASKPRPHAAQVARTDRNTETRSESRMEPRTQTAAVRCANCGVIASVREVEQAGQGTGLGAVGGAVAGGVLGNQVGGGRGQDVMTVVGAVAGGIAGHQIEKKVRSTKNYEITVRMEDGNTRVLTETSVPIWRAGDRVRLIDGRLQAEKA